MNEEIWDKFLLHLENESLTAKRIEKLSFVFNTINRGLNKPFNDVSREDIQDFVTRLHNDKFLNHRKNIKPKPYSESTKADIKKGIKQIWKWLKGDSEFYPKEVSWIKCKIAKDRKPLPKEVITYEEAIQLANSCSKIEHRILFLLLFDSGFRISEMLSVHKKDLTWEDYKGKEKCWHIMCNESKTDTRKVPVPLFTADLQTFTESSYFKSLKEDDPLFKTIRTKHTKRYKKGINARDPNTMSYEAVIKTLKNNSQKVLKKKLTPHSLRHSSATYYAKRLSGDAMALAQRYGWRFNSKELQTYIRLSGHYQELAATKVYENQATKLAEELEEYKKMYNTLKTQVDNVQKEQERQQRKQFIKSQLNSIVGFFDNEAERYKIKITIEQAINDFIKKNRQKPITAYDYIKKHLTKGKYEDYEDIIKKNPELKEHQEIEDEYYNRYDNKIEKIAEEESKKA